MAGETPKQGKFSVEITERVSRRDLPTADVAAERAKAFSDGVGIALIAVLGFLLLALVVAIFVAKH